MSGEGITEDQRVYQVLLTDLDGTLIHSADCICAALEQAFRHVGVVPPIKSDIMGMFGLPVEVMLTTLTSVTEGETERIADFIAEYKRQYPLKMQGATLLDGVKETLQYLTERGIPICLITSERRKNADYILQKLELDGYITHTISRDDVVQFKPHPEPLKKAAALYGTAPENCVYIGESPFDIQAGVAAGVFTVAVPSGHWPLDSLLACGPDHVVAAFAELKLLPFRKNII